MARYINTEDFRKRIDHYPPEIRNVAKKELRYTPTADVVEVVRCKDCKNHEWCSIEEMALNDETFFCKWGERREDVEIHI